MNTFFKTLLVCALALGATFLNSCDKSGDTASPNTEVSADSIGFTKATNCKNYTANGVPKQYVFTMSPSQNRFVVGVVNSSRFSSYFEVVAGTTPVGSFVVSAGNNRTVLYRTSGGDTRIWVRVSNNGSGTLATTSGNICVSY